MKIKTSISSLFIITILSLSIISCSGSRDMAKDGAAIGIECSPKILEVVNNEIAAEYTISFPKNYFRPKVILEVIPVLVYDGGEEQAAPFRLQGESVTDNYYVIPKSGGAKKERVKFSYRPGMERSQLELRIYALDGEKRISFVAPFKVADGANFTSKLVKTDGATAIVPHNYEKELVEQRETQILYNINSADVKAAELSKDEVKAFKTFLKKVEKDSRRKVKSANIIAYASPEGKEDFNTALSGKRGKSAKEAYSKITDKTASNVPVEVESISEDWDGFQDLVRASNIPDKELILRVLSMYSDSQVREREIRNMSKVYSTLAEKILPELRRARVITKIGYENYSEEELLQIANSNPDSLDVEALLYSAALTPNKNKSIELYKLAIKRYNDDRAMNNLAAIYLQDGRIDEAHSVISKIRDKESSYYYNNFGLISLKRGDYAAASAAFTKSDLPEARRNSAITDILTGRYVEAAKKLAGTGDKNEQLAYILANQLDKASKIAREETPEAAYLRAIIAARRGDFSEVARELRVVYKDDALAERSQRDIEFAKFRE